MLTTLKPSASRRSTTSPLLHDARNDMHMLGILHATPDAGRGQTTAPPFRPAAP